MFDSNKKETFSKKEEKILQFWKDRQIFQKSLDPQKKTQKFSFYDGPPFATGLPHYGHLLAGTIKDVIPRYKTMKGYLVRRRFGWDCHGLPVENEIEKSLGLSGAPDIEKLGIAKFNEECRSIVLRHTKDWEKTVERMGRWIEFSTAYRTMDLDYMESVWWVFGQLFDKGLVYRGFKVMPFSAKLGTPLSNFEANLNYKEVDDPSLFVKFALEKEECTYFLAWTTTPWTLISNRALIVNPNLDYVKIQIENQPETYILAKSRLKAVIKEEFTVLEEMKGKDLKGLSYRPVFSYFSGEKPTYSVLCDEFVTTTDGTGVVHAAPAFGEVDFSVCEKAGVELVCPVDVNGKFTKEIPDYEGLFVKDADKEIIKRLKAEGKIYHHGQIRHRYPFCWRSDTPLLYRVVNTWFIAVEKIKGKLIDCVQQISFMPEHIKSGRFGKWVENARDWAVSRNRYWGTPIPIWQSEDGEIFAVHSKKELEEKTGKKIDDLHRHFIDELTIEKEGKIFKRIPEVFDCWFESGSMPYAQNHYPFENTSLTEKEFPADFIAEGLDQTRGWFYTLSVIAAALFNKPAFLHVVVNGIILAEDGAKMSKRLKNYPDPHKVIDQYGADAIRLYLLQSPAVKADDLRFSEKGVELVLRQILLPFYNSYLFLATYVQIYPWNPLEKQDSKALIDRWVLSKSQELIFSVEKAMESYDLNGAVTALSHFIEQLTNWYIRRSRPRFWQEEDVLDRECAFSTLYYVLLQLTKISAPFIPFLSDGIYQELKTEKDPESVHLCTYPQYETKYRDEALEKEMALAQAAVSLGHSLRKEQKIKVRQPLKQATIVVFSPEDGDLIERQSVLIAEELNVKKVEVRRDDSSFVDYQITPNFPVLGKKVGKMIPLIQKQMKTWPQERIKNVLQTGKGQVEIENQQIALDKEDVKIIRKVKPGFIAASSDLLFISLDTELSDELVLEGMMREVVNKINLERKEMGLEVVDRIAITINPTKRIKECFSLYQEHIQKEVLAKNIVFSEIDSGKDLDINGEKICILIEKSN